MRQPCFFLLNYYDNPKKSLILHPVLKSRESGVNPGQYPLL